MFSVIIHWSHKPRLGDIGKRLLFQHYDYVCRAYSADKLVIVDTDGMMTLSPPHPVVRTLEEALAHFDDDITTCGIHPNGETMLKDYQHPDDVVYVVGPDLEGIESMEDIDTSVRIPQANPALELWSDQALAIVLHDRSTRT